MAGPVCMFPGQGAQRAGMAKDLVECFPEVRELFLRADDLLRTPLSKHVLEGPEDVLQDTAVQQPALVLASLAALTALRILLAEKGRTLEPAAALGLSLGEYTALCAAGALTADDALRLVRRRGELMKEAGALRPGGMASVLGADAAAVEAACAEAAAATGCAISACNYNCPGQVVIGGEEAGLAKATEILKAKGAKRVIRLKVSAAFHTALMAPAAEGLAKTLAETPVSRAAFDVVANVSARPVREPEEIRKSLIEQLTNPVRFEQSIRGLAARGMLEYAEVGPGGMLSGMVRRIEGSAKVAPCGTLEEIRKYAAG